MEADEKKCPHCAEIIKADAVVCRYCNRDVHAAPGTPKEVKARGARSKLGGCAIVLVLMILIFAVLNGLTKPGTPLASSPLGVDTKLNEIKDKVANDAVKQYNIAATSGSAMDRCVQAGMVSAAYLQAQDQQQYATWKATEKSDCAAAGMPK